MVKPGYKTTEFWAMVVVNLWTMFSGQVPEPWNGVAVVVITGLYGIARGLAKLGLIKGETGEYLSK